MDNSLLYKELLTAAQYQVWRKKTLEEMEKEPLSERNLEKDEKMRRRRVMEDFYGKQYHYKRVMEVAKQK
jgi:hypothetical protein